MKLSTITMALVFTTFTLVQQNTFATGGVAGTGGGVSNSSQRLEILNMFTNDSKKIKENLIHFVKAVAMFKVTGKQSEQINQLVKAGLVEDINQVKYDLIETDCPADEYGIVYEANTAKDDISFQENPVRHPICISLNRLAQNNATFERIVGHMLHEHARHFGLDDVIGIGPNKTGHISPLSLFYEKYSNYHAFDLNLKDSNQPLFINYNGVVIYNNPDINNSIERGFLPNNSSLKVVIDNIEGPSFCNDVKIKYEKLECPTSELDWFTHNCKPIEKVKTKDKEFSFITNTNENYSVNKYKVSLKIKPTHGLIQAVTFATAIPFFINAVTPNLVCKFDYHWEIEGLKSKAMTTKLERGFSIELNSLLEQPIGIFSDIIFQDTDSNLTK